MSFLDKINAASVNTSDGAVAAAKPKKVNPLLKKKLNTKKKEEGSATPAKKIVPLKKNSVANKEETKVEKQEEVKATEEKVKAAPEKETPKVEKEVKETTKQEPAKKETKKEKTEKSAGKEEIPAEKAEAKEKQDEAKDEPNKEAKEEKVEEKDTTTKKTETKKKTTSTRNNNKKKTTAKKQEAEDTPTDIPTTTMTYSEAIQSITSPFIDEEWEEFKKEIQDELNAIVISNDMNPGTLKVVISELSMLREKVWFSYQEQKTLYENLSSKDPEGLIERVKRINLGSGNNDMERRRAGVLACMEYKTEAGDVNLFEVLDETRSRYNFLKSVIDSIQYKTDVLITLNGALKLEKEHL